MCRRCGVGMHLIAGQRESKRGLEKRTFYADRRSNGLPASHEEKDGPTPLKRNTTPHMQANQAAEQKYERNSMSPQASPMRAMPIPIGKWSDKHERSYPHGASKRRSSHRAGHPDNFDGSRGHLSLPACTINHIHDVSPTTRIQHLLGRDGQNTKRCSSLVGFG